MNSTQLTGRLVDAPKRSTTPNGKAVANLRLAVADKREPLYITVVAWDELSAVCARWQKGDQVTVEGRLQARSWQAADGKKRTSLEVIARTLTLGGALAEAEDQDEEEIPF